MEKNFCVLQKQLFSKSWMISATLWNNQIGSSFRSKEALENINYSKKFLTSSERLSSTEKKNQKLVYFFTCLVYFLNSQWFL